MRLLSLAPSNTEILYALGLGTEVVGTTAFCDYPSDSKNKPKVGGWVTPMAGYIAKLKPDLIFTSYFLPKELEDWDGPGEIVHVAPKNLNGVYKSILTIGTKLNRYKQAQEIVRTMKKEFTQIKKSRPKKKLKLYMEEWHKPPMVSGNWVPEIVAIAGGVEGMIKPSQMSSEFSFEELQTFNPDAMVFHWCGFGEKFNRKIVLERSGWMSLDAVKNGRLFAIDDALLNRPGPRLVAGARKLQEVLTTYLERSSSI